MSVDSSLHLGKFLMPPIGDATCGERYSLLRRWRRWLPGVLRSMLRLDPTPPSWVWHVVVCPTRRRRAGCPRSAKVGAIGSRYWRVWAPSMYRGQLWIGPALRTV